MKLKYAIVGAAALLMAACTTGPSVTVDPPPEQGKMYAGESSGEYIGYVCNKPDVGSHVKDALRRGWEVFEVNQPDAFMYLFNNAKPITDYEADKVYVVDPGAEFVFLLMGNEKSCVFHYKDMIPRIDRNWMFKLLTAYDEMLKEGV